MTKFPPITSVGPKILSFPQVCLWIVEDCPNGLNNEDSITLIYIISVLKVDFSVRIWMFPFVHEFKSKFVFL